MRFNPEEYETVDARLTKFWADHPEGRIETMLLSSPDALDEVIVRAEVFTSADAARPRASGLAAERRGSGGANTTHHVENAETSAIGRALANAGYKTRPDAHRPSREEMARVPNDAPPAARPLASGTRPATAALVCQWDGCGLALTKGQYDVSMGAFKCQLCPAHQKAMREQKGAA